MPADTATVAGTSSARLLGARDEFVSFQVVLPGGSGGQSNVTVAPGKPLSGAAGTIPNSNITIYREEYYNVTQPSAAGRPTGRIPDALIPTVDRLVTPTRR